MKLITIKEHTLHAGVARASAARSAGVSPGFGASYDPASGLPYSPSAEVLEDLDEGRLAAMDAHGIGMQVLSNLTTQFLPADVAPEQVRDVNDRLAAACWRHPERFAAFASLPTTAADRARAGHRPHDVLRPLPLRRQRRSSRVSDGLRPLRGRPARHRPPQRRTSPATLTGDVRTVTDWALLRCPARRGSGSPRRMESRGCRRRTAGKARGGGTVGGGGGVRGARAGRADLGHGGCSRWIVPVALLSARHRHRNAPGGRAGGTPARLTASAGAGVGAGWGPSEAPVRLTSVRLMFDQEPPAPEFTKIPDGSNEADVRQVS
ncbi:hypothetical protein RVR_8849 [Actinacidiphila reveromycinica]|uniref:Uncharacterized protein n=1 Tax=Actinacidiphila reveromycinica TaxID=659352 RepID=A0A7U3UWB6_9ACTN|nr:hypothetical protein [Streptomyces sp. SN-593]BBB01431.1 hypothetical protein RVR_8849 [Streptomyces sp. SN-593]